MDGVCIQESGRGAMAVRIKGMIGKERAREDIRTVSKIRLERGLTLP